MRVCVDTLDPRYAGADRGTQAHHPGAPGGVGGQCGDGPAVPVAAGNVLAAPARPRLDLPLAGEHLLADLDRGLAVTGHRAPGALLAQDQETLVGLDDERMAAVASGRLSANGMGEPLHQAPLHGVCRILVESVPQR